VIFDDPYIRWMVGKYCRSEEINTVIKQTCATLGHAGYEKEITWSWERRMTATLGYAVGERQITFSASLWLALSDDNRKNVIVHEVCHLFVQKLFGHNRVIDGEKVTNHGQHWKDLMTKCKEPANRLIRCELP